MKVYVQILCAALVGVGANTSLGQAVTRYVVKDNAGQESPYDTWDNAAPDIQTAVDAANATNGDEVIVNSGVYDTGGRPYPGMALTNRVVIDKAITVRSLSDNSADTVIRGVWDVMTNGPAAVRCVYLASKAKLIGFTITNGATLRTGTQNDVAGGGVFAAANDAIVSNCVIAGNAAHGYDYGSAGGGAYYGTFHNCTFTGNLALPAGKGEVVGRRSRGGAASASILWGCRVHANRADGGGGLYGSAARMYGGVLSNNTATGGTGGGANGATLHGVLIVDNWASAGGGAQGGVLSNCWVVGNAATNGNGGGVLASTVYNSVISNNTASSTGGGAREATIYDSLIVANYSGSGGGGTCVGTYRRCVLAYNSSVGAGGAYLGNYDNCLIYGNYGGWIGGGGAGGSYDQCTVVGNYALSRGGGLSESVRVVNCVVYGNYAPTDGPNLYLIAANVISNSCTFPAVSGWNASNLVVDPKLVNLGSGYGTNHVAGDYRLSGTSPCLNAGANTPEMVGATDLIGNPRLDKLTGTVDMGCYEYVYRGTVLLVR